MPEGIVDKPVDRGVGGTKKSRAARKTDTPAERLLLQLHRSLLVRGIASQLTYRAINTLVVIFNLMIGFHAPYAWIATVGVASLVAYLWHCEQRVLSIRLGAVERSLAKKNSIEYEDIYINYKFESTSGTAKFWAIRFEPLLWLAAIVINVVCYVALNLAEVGWRLRLWP